MKKRTLKLACLRGLFNTDGCIYARYSKRYNRHKKIYRYGVVQFKFNNNFLISQLYKILKQEKCNPNKIIKDKNSFICRITDQNQVRKFFLLIKTKHPYHLKRFRKIMEGRTGFEPAATWLLQPTKSFT